MDSLEIAQLKDSILNYLNDRSKKNIPSEVVYSELKLENVPSAIYNVSLKEMDRENVIHTTDTSGNRSILILTEAGRKLLSEGGYVKRLDEEFRKDKQREDDVLHENEKTVLEAKDLKASIKGAYALSIIAVMISIASLLYTIFTS
ncbi:MAG: hypothetical protein EHM47_18910 [Ignavibacteriales bacterium]|nr:MAG: hypothetical protein EHM47_18910 [Ignavibacteriales bacterium]